MRAAVAVAIRAERHRRTVSAVKIASAIQISANVTR
jgi:hypothetical protein